MSGEALLCNYLIMKVYCVFKDIFLKNESMYGEAFSIQEKGTEEKNLYII